MHYSDSNYCFDYNPKKKFSHSLLFSELDFGAIPSAKETENCSIHKSFPIEYFCPSCPESPMKCAKCAMKDRNHLDKHIELSQQGFDANSILATKIQELRKSENKLAPYIASIQLKMRKVR